MDVPVETTVIGKKLLLKTGVINNSTAELIKCVEDGRITHLEFYIRNTKTVFKFRASYYEDADYLSDLPYCEDGYCEITNTQNRTFLSFSIDNIINITSLFDDNEKLLELISAEEFMSVLGPNGIKADASSTNSKKEFTEAYNENTYKDLKQLISLSL